MKDELNSHLVLFKFIFQTTIEESFNGKVPDIVVEKAIKLIKDSVEVTRRWSEYSTKGLLGFSPRSIEVFIYSRANEICRNLSIEPIYNITGEPNPLDKLMKSYLAGEEGADTRQNFFLQNVLNYNKGGMKDDWD